MKAKIHLRKILDKQIDVQVFGTKFPDTFNAILKAMKDACDQTVDLCIKNAEWDYGITDNHDDEGIAIDKQSILNVKNLIK